jgi:hypothetical protein
MPVANYSRAIAKAVEWLGDRYLLAKPINAAPGRESHAIAGASNHSSMVAELRSKLPMVARPL